MRFGNCCLRREVNRPSFALFALLWVGLWFGRECLVCLQESIGIIILSSFAGCARVRTYFWFVVAWALLHDSVIPRIFVIPKESKSKKSK